MNADAFRQFYEYHFAENRKVWDLCTAQLTLEQFTRPASYSRGPVREQILHLMDADDVWFSELRGIEPTDPASPADGDDRDALRARWDGIEQKMRVFLAGLRDEDLFSKPIREPEEDQVLFVWQVLLHVANHATDHRAQLLRQLNDLGVKTESQDLIFYIYEHLEEK